MMKDLMLVNIEKLTDAVLQEHFKQVKKWGRQDLEISWWLNFVVEEVGELAEAIAENTFRNGSKGDIFNEAIQVVTLALKIAEMHMEHEEKNSVLPQGLVWKKEHRSISEFLSRWMGDCWHNWGDVYYSALSGRYICSCTVCGKVEDAWQYFKQPDYFTPEGFVRLWERAKGSGEFETFIRVYGNGYIAQPSQSSGVSRALIDISLVSPGTFPKKWAEFLGYKKEEV